MTVEKTEWLIEWSSYIRASSEEQKDEHQYDDLREWFNKRDVDFSEVKKYVDYAQSGASDTREDFLDIIEDIEDGKVGNVVVWEISRVARRGSLSQRFFDAAENNGTTIHIVNGAIERIKPDGTNRLVADIIAAVYAEERRTLIRRTRSGIKRARKEGKWTGQVPTGFYRDDNGFLKPNLILDYENDEVGFVDIVDALETLDEDEDASYRGLAEGMNLTRQTLSTIYKEKKHWYLPVDEEIEDDRVAEAVEEVRGEVR